MNARLSLLCCLLLQVFFLSGQTITAPESVAFNANTGDYYISCPGNHSILKRDPAGTLSVFVPSSPSLQFPRGMCIVDTVLYVTDLVYIRGFSLVSGNQVFTVAPAGAQSLNDIVASDAGDYLYASDDQASIVYKIDIAAQTSLAWVSSGLVSPNGLWYDGPNNRLVVVEFSTFGVIKSIFLNNASLMTMIATTPGMLDGITRDNLGYWYISSWATDKIYRYVPQLIGTPLEVNVSPYVVSGPADIFCNTTTTPHTLVIPSMNNNQVYYLPLAWAGLEDQPILTPLTIHTIDNQITINSDAHFTDDLVLKIFNSSGSLVMEKTLDDLGQNQESTFPFPFSPGLYLYSCESSQGAAFRGKFIKSF